MQVLINLAEWQQKMNKKNMHKQLELDLWLQRLKKEKTDRSTVPWKTLQLNKVKAELYCPKIGRLNLKKRRCRSAVKLKVQPMDKFMERVLRKMGF